MRLRKSIYTLFFLVLGVSFIQIYAQEINSQKQYKILNDYKTVPFEDGKTIIQVVDFIGLDSVEEKYDKSVGKSIPQDELIKYLKSNRQLIEVGDKFYGHKVSKLVKTLKKEIISIGYVNAEVEVFGELLPQNKMKLTFFIKRGSPVLVSEIRFEGNLRITHEELLGSLKLCLKDNWFYFDERRYEYCLQKNVREYMFSKGFFQARINLLKPKMVSNSYIVNIKVQEGVRFRIGEIDIINPKTQAYSNKEILEMSGIKFGDIADGKKLRIFLFEDLKNKYADKGFIEYEVELNPSFVEPIAEGLDGAVNVKITIYEGAEFKVGKIEFVGVDEEEKSRLKEILLLKEGETYSQTKFELSIEEINRLEEFYPIYFDVDVETRATIISNDERPVLKREEANGIDFPFKKARYSPEVYILIRVKKRNKNDQ